LVCILIRKAIPPLEPRKSTTHRPGNYPQAWKLETAMAPSLQENYPKLKLFLFRVLTLTIYLLDLPINNGIF